MTTPETLPDERRSLTHKFQLGDFKGYMAVGFDNEGRSKEIFVWPARADPAVSGLIDTICIATSVALRHGTPVSKLIQKFRGQTYEPSGFTGNPAIPYAKSFADYVAAYLELLESQVPVVAKQSPEGDWYGGRGARSAHYIVEPWKSMANKAVCGKWISALIVADLHAQHCQACEKARTSEEAKNVR